MHRAPFSAWQGVMVPHVMWCAGHRPRSTDAASRPCSIDGGCLAALFDQCRSLAGLCGRERCLHALRDLFLKIQETRHAIVSVSFGSLMVHRQQWGTSWGAKKFNFLIRDIDDATMTAASVESCRFVVLRSPRGRLGSVKYMCKRLRRMRGHFPLQIHLPRCISSKASAAQNAIARGAS